MTTPNNFDTETIFRVLFAVAWSDGELAEQEQVFLKGLYERVETDFDAGSWFRKPPEAPEWNRFRADRGTREALLRQAMHLAAADETVSFEENWLLDRLRANLNIKKDRFHELQKEVEEQRA
jgi:tellurite resistance protein